MAIKGFQGTSLLDYPGRIASLLFFAGCNLTCPFCHNPSLVLEPEELDDYPPEEVLEELSARRQFIDGVVLTGGEPTLAPELIPLIKEIRQLGLLVKLDTNGLAPQVLDTLLRHRLVDYVALDLKTSPDRYGELHRGPVSLGALKGSVELLLGGDVTYEIRTTCIPGLVERSDLERMGEMLRGVDSWVLQQFVPEYALDPAMQELTPYSADDLSGLLTLARQYVPAATMRGT